MMELVQAHWPLAAALLATGVFAGVLAGLLGVGGGIVIVPVLYHAFEAIGVDDTVRMHLAVGTSLATIIPTSIRSLRSHAKRGAVDWALLKAWAPGLFIGVVAGSVIAGFVDSRALVGLFGVIAALAALNMAFGKEDWRFADTPPGGVAQMGMSTGVGGVSVLMGIGGGTLGVPILNLFGFDPKRAVATAAGFGLIISIPGAIGLMIAGYASQGLPIASLGYVNLLGFALITPMTVLSAPLGVQIAHALPKAWLARAFAVFLGLTSAQMLISFFSTSAL